MKKLFSTAYGSRLYGTQTPTSDLDLKHIVLPNLNSLLLGKKLENKVKKTNTDKNIRNSQDDVDEEFIPIQIFARHFVEGQTYAIELAFAVDGDHAQQVIYKDPRPHKVMLKIDGLTQWVTSPPLFIEFIHELRTKFLTSNIKGIIGYVVNQASMYSFKGERLNATRELKVRIVDAIQHLKHADATTEEFDISHKSQLCELMSKYPKYFRKDTYDVGGGVMKPCFIILEKTLPFTNTLQQTLKVLNALENKYGSRSDQTSQINVDWKATMHALRIVDEGLQLLSTHELTFPFKQDYVDRLLSIKRGEISIEVIKLELAEKLDRLKDLEKISTLQPCTQELLQELDVWLIEKLQTWYGL